MENVNRPNAFGGYQHGPFAVTRERGRTSQTVVANIQPIDPIRVSCVFLPEYGETPQHGRHLRLSRQERNLVGVMFGDTKAVKKPGYIVGAEVFTDPCTHKPEQIETLVYYKVTDIAGNDLNSISKRPRIINGYFVQNAVEEVTFDEHEALQNQRIWEQNTLSMLEEFTDEADPAIIRWVKQTLKGGYSLGKEEDYYVNKTIDNIIDFFSRQPGSKK